MLAEGPGAGVTECQLPEHHPVLSLGFIQRHSSRLGFLSITRITALARVCPSLHPQWVNSTFSLEEGYLNIHMIMKKTQPYRIYINSYVKK